MATLADYPYGLDDYLSMVAFPDAVPAYDAAFDAAYDAYNDLDFDALPTLGSPMSPLSPVSPVSPSASFDASPYVFASPASTGKDALDLWPAFDAPEQAAVTTAKPAISGVSALFAASPAIDPVQLTGRLPTNTPAATTSSPSHRSSGVRKTSAASGGDHRRRTSSVQQPPKKTAHNLIEKRYRTNLNDKILALRDAVPALRGPGRAAGGGGSGSGSSSGSDEDELDREFALPENDDENTAPPPPHKLNKATILSKATDYILQLEQRNQALARANEVLLRQVDGMQMRSMSGGGLGGVWC